MSDRSLFTTAPVFISTPTFADDNLSGGSWIAELVAITAIFRQMIDPISIFEFVGLSRKHKPMEIFDNLYESASTLVQDGTTAGSCRPIGVI